MHRCPSFKLLLLLLLLLNPLTHSNRTDFISKDFSLINFPLQFCLLKILSVQKGLSYQFIPIPVPALDRSYTKIFFRGWTLKFILNYEFFFPEHVKLFSIDQVNSKQFSLNWYTLKGCGEKNTIQTQVACGLYNFNNFKSWSQKQDGRKVINVKLVMQTKLTLQQMFNYIDLSYTGFQEIRCKIALVLVLGLLSDFHLCMV